MIDFNLNADSEFFGTKKHSGSNRSEYIRHEISVWVEFEKETIEYQTGNSFFGGDFNCPNEELEFYDVSNDQLRELIMDELDEDIEEIELKSGKKITVEQARNLLHILEQRAGEEFELVTGEMSDDPDDYYMNTFDGQYELKKEGAVYCVSNELEHEGEIVEAHMYQITDTRNNSTELVAELSEEGAAKKAGVFISNYNSQYIDRDYKVELYLDVLTKRAADSWGGDIGYATSDDKLQHGTDYNYVWSAPGRNRKFFISLSDIEDYMTGQELMSA